MSDGSGTVGAKPRILVIDDEPLVRRTVVRALSRGGYEVHEASDGLEGLLKLKDTQYDAVICDGRMPGMFGAEVYDEAQAMLGSAAMPAWVFNSGGGCDFDALRQRAPLLEKPYTAENLLDAVRVALQIRRRYV